MSILFNTYLFLMFCRRVYKHTHVPGVHRGQKRVLDALNLELKMVVRKKKKDGCEPPIGIGNQT